MAANELTIHDFDFGALIEFAQSAKGDIFMKTADGDVLNLRSKLTQLLALSGNIDWGTIGEATVVCENAEDEQVLFRMNLFGKKN